MDKNDTIIDIKHHLEAEFKKNEAPKEKLSFHSNPILKKLFAFNIRKSREKFGVKDLFR